MQTIRTLDHQHTLRMVQGTDTDGLYWIRTYTVAVEHGQKHTHNFLIFAEQIHVCYCTYIGL